MSNVDIVPATRQIIDTFYPELPMTVRAYAGIKDGEILGVGGYYVKGQSVMVFSDIKPGTPARAIMRGVRKVMDMVALSGMPAIAIPDPEIEGASKFLKHIGFVEMEDKPGVYIWQTPILG